MMLPAYDPKSSLQCRRIIHFVLREVTILDFKSRRRPGRIKSAINRVHHSQTRKFTKNVLNTFSKTETGFNVGVISKQNFARATKLLCKEARYNNNLKKRISCINKLLCSSLPVCSLNFDYNTA